MEIPSNTAPKLRRSWRAISLRGMLLLILIVGAPMGWWARKAHLQRAAVARIEAANGAVTYGSEILDAAGTTTTPEASARAQKALEKVGFRGFSRPSKARPPEPFKDWVRKSLGVDFVDSVTHVFIIRSDKITDEDFRAMADLPNLKNLQLTQSQVTDSQMALIGQLFPLEILDLSYAKISDDGLAGLKGLKNLKNLKNLRELNLNGTQITDAGLKELDGLTALQKVTLYNAEKVTSEGIKRLGEAHPELSILHNPIP